MSNHDLFATSATEDAFANMARLEPRLVVLENVAYGGPRDGEDLRDGWHRIQRELAGLVGWFCDRAALRSNKRYSEARDHLKGVYFFGRTKGKRGTPPWELADVA